MDYTKDEVLQLKQVWALINKQIGKFEQKDALSLIKELDLSDNVKAFVKQAIDQWAKEDTFAGFGRFDGLAARIEVHLLRKTGERVL